MTYKRVCILIVELHNEYEAKKKVSETELAFADIVHIWVISIWQYAYVIIIMLLPYYVIIWS